MLCNNFKYLSLLIVGDKNIITSKILEKLQKHYFKIFTAEDELESINLYQKYKINIVLICDSLDSVSIDTIVHFIKGTKKNQVILLFGENNIEYNVSKMVRNPINLLSLARDLIYFNEYVMQRTQIRNEILKNRLALCIKKKKDDFSFVYKIDSKNNQLTWINICENCLHINSVFEALIDELKYKKEVTKIQIKYFAKILNNYYQIFNLIEDTNDLSFFLLKYARIFYSYEFGDFVKYSDLKDMFRYIYIEILYFQYILFYRNELKNINYFKSCLINSFSLFQRRLTI